MQEINIDLIPQKEKPILSVSQFDDNWTVKFNITENGEAISLFPTDIVTCIIRKPDNNIVTIECTTAPTGSCTCALTEQACACYGLAYGQLVIEDANQTKHKGTCNFILDVEISPEFGGIESTSVIANLQRQIAAIVGVEVSEIAPEIVAEIAPTIIGADYLTKDQIANLYYNKTQIDTNYYTKTQVDNAISLSQGHVLTGTLTAGNTSITIVDSDTNAPIDDNSFIDPYTNIYGVSPTDITIDSTNHTITLTFDAQETDLIIKVRVK